MKKIKIGEVAVHTPEEAMDANTCIRKANSSWIGKLYRSQEFLDTLQGEDDKDTEWIAPDGWVNVGALALYDDAYIIPFFENLLSALDARKEIGLVFRISEELRVAYDAQWEKVRSIQASLRPKVTGSMARRRTEH